MNFTRKWQSVLDKRISNLGDCTKILGGASASSLIEAANQIQFFNGSFDAPGASRSQNAVSNNGISTTLATTVSGSVVASTLTYKGQVIGDVVLGTNFFNDPTVSQSDVLLHEALHFALGMDDSQLKGWLQGYGFEPQQYGTDDITQWLKANCPDPQKP